MKKEATPYAKIEPLHGKYYGTVISVGGQQLISVWGNRVGKPSTRELNYSHVSPEDKNEIMELMCDGHYEDEGDYIIALKIVTLLNYDAGMSEG